MGYNTKNYREQGGEKTVIGGEVILAADCIITDERPCPIPYIPASGASTAANAVKDLNVLIGHLKEAGLIEPEIPTLQVAMLETEVASLVGEAAVLSVQAEASDGRALAYQWYSNTGATNTGGTLISGATASTYEAPTSSAGTAYYYCVVSDATAGATKAFADAATEACTVTVTEA
ncbi:hypothetical protein [Pleomorphochaeta sp. DL1XJH-081]|uniref:hypothetical protein n=1 Tax=Pleomorphochaeta sp. DL1XJH-081 TaxID=3409690 RepID=UPI003BB80C1E